MQTLARYDPNALGALGFYEHAQELLEHLIDAIERTTDPHDKRPLAESVLTRIRNSVPDHTNIFAHLVITVAQRNRAAANSDGGCQKTSPPHPAPSLSQAAPSSSHAKTSTASSATSDRTTFRPGTPGLYRSLPRPSTCSLSVSE